MEDRQQLGADLVGERDTANQRINRVFSTAPLHDYLLTDRLDWQLTGPRPYWLSRITTTRRRSEPERTGSFDRHCGVSPGGGKSPGQGLTADWVHIFTPAVINRLSFLADNNFINTTSALSQKTPQITFPNIDDGATYRVPQQTLPVPAPGR